MNYFIPRSFFAIGARFWKNGCARTKYGITHADVKEELYFCIAIENRKPVLQEARIKLKNQKNMARIVVKAQQQAIHTNNRGVEQAHVLRPIRYSTMKSDDIVEYCSSISMVPKAYIQASVVALSQCIEFFMLNGHSVEFPGLGIFSLTSNGISESDVNKAGVEQLNKLRIRFLPCTSLKDKVEAVELELDGIYDIAGVDDKGKKYYKNADGDGHDKFPLVCEAPKDEQPTDGKEE